MSAIGPNYIKGFVETCYRYGLHEKQAAVLLQVSADTSMQKQAGLLSLPFRLIKKFISAGPTFKSKALRAAGVAGTAGIAGKVGWDYVRDDPENKINRWLYARGLHDGYNRKEPEVSEAARRLYSAMQQTPSVLADVEVDNTGPSVFDQVSADAEGKNISTTQPRVRTKIRTDNNGNSIPIGSAVTAELANDSDYRDWLNYSKQVELMNAQEKDWNANVHKGKVTGTIPNRILSNGIAMSIDDFKRKKQHAQDALRKSEDRLSSKLRDIKLDLEILHTHKNAEADYMYKLVHNSDRNQYVQDVNGTKPGFFNTEPNDDRFRQAASPINNFWQTDPTVRENLNRFPTSAEELHRAITNMNKLMPQNGNVTTYSGPSGTPASNGYFYNN